MALQRLADFDPDRQKRYQERAAKFEDDAAFLTDVTLPLLDDSGYIPRRNNCNPVQVIIQQKPKFPGDKIYLINNKFWGQLSAQDQAILILHEIIYQEALERGQTNSISTRYYNALVFSGEIEKKTKQEYFEILNYVGLLYYLQTFDFGTTAYSVMFFAARIDYDSARDLCLSHDFTFIGGTYSDYAHKQPIRSHILKQTQGDDFKIWSRDSMKYFLYEPVNPQGSVYNVIDSKPARPSERHGVLCEHWDIKA